MVIIHHPMLWEWKTGSHENGPGFRGMLGVLLNPGVSRRRIRYPFAQDLLSRPRKSCTYPIGAHHAFRFRLLLLVPSALLVFVMLLAAVSGYDDSVSMQRATGLPLHICRDEKLVLLEL